jgi:hypothetical protein
MSLLCKTCLQLVLLAILAEPAPPAPSSGTSAPIYVESVYVPPTASSSASEPPAAALAPVQSGTPAAAPAPSATSEAALGPGPAFPLATAAPGAPARSMGRESVDAQNNYVRQLEQQLRLSALAARQTGRATEAALVVPNRQTEPQSADPLVEDLTIMSRIIQKSLADGYLLPEVSAMDSLIINLTLPSQNMGPRLFFPLTRRPKPMYIGGYGALFFLQVDFPLVPPAEQGQQAGAEESDPVWSEARRSLYEAPGAGFVANAAPVEAYSEDKVALLRSRLIEIMKHATNIRSLDPNDSVTIVVRGAPVGDVRPSTNAVPGLPNEAPCGRTVLTLRARKPDIDQYAKGQLDPAQFEQRLQITNYKQ